MILFDKRPFPSLKRDAELFDALRDGRLPWDWKQSSPVEKILSSCCAVSPDARPTMGEAFGSLVDACPELDSSSSFEMPDLKIKALPPAGPTNGPADPPFALSGDSTDPKEVASKVQSLPELTPELFDTGVDASVAISPEAQDGILGLEPLPGLLLARVSPDPLKTVQTGETNIVSLQQEAETPRQKINNLAAGGDLAVLTLRGINTTADWCPPIKNATGAALFIFDEAKNFKENAREWTNFGEYVATTMADAASAIKSGDVSESEAMSWVESVTDLDGALQKIKSEIEKREKVAKRSINRKTFSSLRRIDDLKKDFDKALALFQVRTKLITGAKLAVIEHRIHDDKILDSLRCPIVHDGSTQACLEGTRVDLTERIMAWCYNTGDSENRLMLLTAVAGAGKTSIALTIAERCASDATLLLLFFFKAGEQSRPDSLFSGIARALADHDPVYHTFITSALRKDPSLSTASLTTQFQELVAPPLLHKPPPPDRPMVIIIDALDECDEDVFEPLAEILRDEVSMLPSSVKFFITSRQFDLVNRYLSPDYPIDRLTIDLLDEANVQDCARFIRFQLQRLKKLHPDLRHRLHDEDKMVQEISERANGLFTWISTIFRYMKLAKKNPMRTLESLLDTGAKRPEVPAEKMMDDLYTSILKKCAWEDEDFAHDYPIVIGAIFVAQQPLSMTAWDTILLPFLQSSVRYVLAELAPLLSGVEDHYTPVRILHQSFRDFIVNRINSQTISPHCRPVTVGIENARVALRCIEILNQDLCSVEGLGLIENVSEKDEMPPIPPNELSEHFHYACCHIIHHLSGVQEPTQQLAGSVAVFLSQEATCWMEVCVRMETYVSISLLPEWAKLAVVHRSKDAVGTLTNVLTRLHWNLGFFSRFQEAYEAANDSVALCRYLFSVDSSSYAPHLAESLNSLYSALYKLGRHSEALPFAEESVKLRRQLVAINPGYTPDLAMSLNNLHNALSNLGQYSKALLSIKESVRLYRQLVVVNPGLITPDLALSLNNLRNALSKLGRHSEALPFIEESVKLYRQLVVINPGSYTPDLARSLNNLRNALSKLGRHSEALPFIEESVKLNRQLVAIHPESYTPDLARSLNNLYNALSDLGRHSEALSFIEETVRLWHRLVAVHPGSYTPNLAGSLNNIYNALSHLGQHSEGLPFIEESVQLYRQLVAVHPGSYTPNLAGSLNNLYNALSHLGRYSEALPFLEESIKLWRQLFAVHPGSYAPNLAGSLNNLYNALSHLGQHSEALPFIEECVTIWRQLVGINPGAHTPKLAKSVENLRNALSNLGRYSEAQMVHI
ncbi:uncharacterized protein EI90DRAFT_1766464 [Cantharellus anzutake]|uniref:uncharacterized protein n=1 Tax=Cantharellus anzutake TaxID=1750568 RepID=UPI001904C7E8|nr:uncharacterized protein EI90DRAFT_1766464 [Cantharellus anzutake]KAF8327560.1 hypothetical protein EI90DRAFT_1766464 [Cantharellus anzutake]